MVMILTSDRQVLANSASPDKTAVNLRVFSVNLVGVPIFRNYHKVPKFSDARKLRCNLPKIQTKSPNHKGILSKMVEME